MTSERCNEQDALQQLARVLSSSGFARNERMSRFLRFLVERHLQGRDDEIKESVIAVEVFNRKPDYDPKQDSIVRTEAGRLRARLAEYYTGEGRGEPIIIELPKGGYIPKFRHVETTPQGRPTRGGRWRAWAVAAVVLAAAAAGWWSVRREHAPIPIAVLPLESLSQNSADAYFADGLTDEIIRNLSAIEGLAVRSRTSVFTFKNKPRNVREAGTQLEADYLLEGSVLRAGQQLRISAQLIRVRDDVPVWSGQFDRSAAEVFAIQDEISRGIVNQLRLNLGRGRWRYETSVDAYDIYLQARTRSFGGVIGTIESIGEFEQAIAKDSSFAPAYAGLGAAYATRSIMFPLAHPPDELVKMRSAAKKATELDPLLAEGQEALALAYARDAEWDQAERSFRRAIELDRNRSRTFTDFAMWDLNVVGRNKEGLEQLRLAQAADPLAPDVQLGLAWLLMSLGRYDEAAAYCLKMSGDDPHPLKIQCLGRVRLGQGKIEEAVQLLAQDPDLSGNPQGRGFFGYALARSGRREEAARMAAGSHFANEQALIYAGLGDQDHTLEALERMAVVGAQRVGQYLNYPELSLLRADPRLKAFRKKVGLPL
jgi:TolB-like protein/Flp pilus assembly protein TadD